jgi:hypothetical protein
MRSEVAVMTARPYSESAMAGIRREAKRHHAHADDKCHLGTCLARLVSMIDGDGARPYDAVDLASVRREASRYHDHGDAVCHLGTCPARLLATLDSRPARPGPKSGRE